VDAPVEEWKELNLPFIKAITIQWVAFPVFGFIAIG
jgi:hypothetical protein